MLLTLAAALLAPRPHPVASVTIEKGAEAWTATYQLPSDEKAWAFQRSALSHPERTSWRVGEWQVLADDVRLVRRGDADVIVADKGTVPRTLTLMFKPRTQQLFADYEPALAFSDGSLALFTGHFDLRPEQTESHAYPNARVTLKAAGRTILVGGHVSKDAAWPEGSPSYALIGETAPFENEVMTAFIDPGLPDWAKSELTDFTPQVMDYYAREMGDLGEAAAKPTILVSWKGPTAGTAGLSGGALPGMIAMAIEGERIVKPDEDMGHRMRWFIAHEAAHFWLGQKLEYVGAEDAWIMEGGADLAAIAATAKLRPGFDVEGELAREWRDCEEGLAKGTLASARQRGDFRMPYACGAVLMQGGAAVLGSDIFGLARAMLAAETDGSVSLEDWLALLKTQGASARVLTLARSLVTQETKNPRDLLANWAEATGVQRPQTDR